MIMPPVGTRRRQLKKKGASVAALLFSFSWLSLKGHFKRNQIPNRDRRRWR